MAFGAKCVHKVAKNVWNTDSTDRSEFLSDSSLGHGDRSARVRTFELGEYRHIMHSKFDFTKLQNIENDEN